MNPYRTNARLSPRRALWSHVAPFVLLAPLVLLVACQKDGKGPTVPQITETAGLAVCIFDTLTPCVVAHQPWPACVEDVIKACGTDAATVATVWAAHTKSETIEGFTPVALISPVPQN